MARLEPDVFFLAECHEANDQREVDGIRDEGKTWEPAAVDVDNQGVIEWPPPSPVLIAYRSPEERRR